MNQRCHGTSLFDRLALELKVILKHLLLLIKYDFSLHTIVWILFTYFKHCCYEYFPNKLTCFVHCVHENI